MPAGVPSAASTVRAIELKLERVDASPRSSFSIAIVIVYVRSASHARDEKSPSALAIDTRSAPGGSTWHAVQSHPRSRGEPV